MENRHFYDGREEVYDGDEGDNKNRKREEGKNSEGKILEKLSDLSKGIVSDNSGIDAKGESITKSEIGKIDMSESEFVGAVLDEEEEKESAQKSNTGKRYDDKIKMWKDLDANSSSAVMHKGNADWIREKGVMFNNIQNALEEKKISEEKNETFQTLKGFMSHGAARDDSSKNSRKARNNGNKSDKE